MKLYDKAEQILRYSEPGIKLKIRDCNGGDIYNWKDSCTFNALGDLFRKNPDNESFIAAGGMYDANEIKSVCGERPQYKFRYFETEQSTPVTSEFLRSAFEKIEEQEKVFKEESGVNKVESDIKVLQKELMDLEQKIIRMTGDSSELKQCERKISAILEPKKVPVEELFQLRAPAVGIMWQDQEWWYYLDDADQDKLDKLFPQCNELYEEARDLIKKHQEKIELHDDLQYQKERIMMGFFEDKNDEFQQLVTKHGIPNDMLVDLIPTNDLSSAIRFHISYLVFSSATNKHLERYRYLNSGIKNELNIKIGKKILGKLTPRISLYDSFSINYKKRNSKIFMLYYDGVGNVRKTSGGFPVVRSISFASRRDSVTRDYRPIFSSVGINYALFLDEYDHKALFQGPIKTVFNQKTVTECGHKYRQLAMVHTCVTNPFSSVIALAGFDDHARLILQY